MRRRLGMTLIEVMIASCLMLLLLGLLVTLLGNAASSFHLTEGRSANGQSLNNPLWRISQELCDSKVTLVATRPEAFSFPSAYDAKGRFTTDPSGLPVYQKTVVYYVKNGALLRRETADTGLLTSAQLAGYCNGVGSRLAGAVTTLALTTSVSNHTATLSMTARTKGGSGKTDEQSASLLVYLRQ